MKKEKKDTISAIVLKGVEGDSLYINDYRMIGPKPWGGGHTIFERHVNTREFLDDLIRALGDSKIELLINIYKCKKSGGHQFERTDRTYEGRSGTFAVYKCKCCGAEEGRKVFDSPGEIKVNSKYDDI